MSIVFVLAVLCYHRIDARSLLLHCRTVQIQRSPLALQLRLHSSRSGVRRLSRNGDAPPFTMTALLVRSPPLPHHDSAYPCKLCNCNTPTHLTLHDAPLFLRRCSFFVHNFTLIIFLQRECCHCLRWQDLNLTNTCSSSSSSSTSAPCLPLRLQPLPPILLVQPQCPAILSICLHPSHLRHFRRVLQLLWSTVAQTQNCF